MQVTGTESFLNANQKLHAEQAPKPNQWRAPDLVVARSTPRSLWHGGKNIPKCHRVRATISCHVIEVLTSSYMWCECAEGRHHVERASVAHLGLESKRRKPGDDDDQIRWGVEKCRWRDWHRKWCEWASPRRCWRSAFSKTANFRPLHHSLRRMRSHQRRVCQQFDDLADLSQILAFCLLNCCFIHNFFNAFDFFW